MPRGYKYIKETLIEAVLQKFPQNKDKYIYSSVIYKNVKTYVDIICVLHGIFQQTPQQHLKGNGCPKCAVEKQTKTHQQFFEDAQKIHPDKYIYLSSYAGYHIKIKMQCKTCNHVFQQTPNDHLCRGSGCPKCGIQESSKKLNERAKTFKDEKTGFYINNKIWNKYKKGAIERNLLFEITPEDVFEKFKEQNGLCAFSGAKLNCIAINSKDINWSIDRTDNMKGYTKDNIILVTKTANIIRNKSTVKELLEFCNMVASRKNLIDKYSAMSSEEKAKRLETYSILYNKKKD
jgi:hypothetical protein